MCKSFQLDIFVVQTQVSFGVGSSIDNPYSAAKPVKRNHTLIICDQLFPCACNKAYKYLDLTNLFSEVLAMSGLSV